MTRKYTRFELCGQEILRMRAEGKSRREIWEYLNITPKQYENFITRHNQREKMLMAGIVPRKKGRPSKEYLHSEVKKDDEIKRLRMENALLRDFLRIAGRK